MSEYRIEDFNGGFDVFQGSRFVLHTTTRNQAEIVVGMLKENSHLHARVTELETEKSEWRNDLRSLIDLILTPAFPDEIETRAKKYLAKLDAVAPRFKVGEHVGIYWENSRREFLIDSHVTEVRWHNNQYEYRVNYDFFAGDPERWHYEQWVVPSAEIETVRAKLRDGGES